MFLKLGPRVLAMLEPWAGISERLRRNCDASNGKAELLRNYKWLCVQCHHTDRYSSDEIERYEHKVERPKKQRV